MTPVQERLMMLMDEIDDITGKLGLHYILGERTAGRAVRTGSFIHDEFEFNIHMSLHDAVLFREYVERELHESRIVETWENNSSLKRLMFRYVDRGSLLLDESREVFYKYPGIAVTIHIARGVCLPDKVTGCERYLMMINGSGEEPLEDWKLLNKMRRYRNVFGEKRTRKKFRVKDVEAVLENHEGFHIGGKKYDKMGPDALARYIELENEAAAKEEEGKELWHLTLKGCWNPLPVGLFEDVERIPFEGRMLQVTKHMNEYMSVVVGRKWVQTCETLPPSASENNIIAETDLPFEDFLEFTKDDGISYEEILKERRSYKLWKNKYYLPASRKVSKDFRKVRCSQVRIDTWAALKPYMEELRGAYENRDTKTISRILKAYLKYTDKFYKDKLGFFISDTILDYADLVWKEKGLYDYREKVYALVPEPWKHMDLEAHLAKYE